MKTVNLIITSDWHLREDKPICRTDDFWETQWKKVQFIKDLQEKYECPVIHAGDLFHHWKPSPYLLSVTMAYLPQQFKTIYGQHDLPQHSLELQNKCGIYTLFMADALKILESTHWGNVPDDKTVSYVGFKKVLVWHTMVYKGESPYFGGGALSAKEMLKRYPNYDLIVTGDNHQTFIEEYKGRLLVNPGSLTRQTAAQIDHKPCVFLWYAETNTVEQVFLPIEEGVISREHISEVEKRNDRINAFIAGLNTSFEMGISFEANLQKFFENNEVTNEVKELIQKFINNEKV